MTAPKPMQAIRAKCLDCSNHSTLEIRECGVDACPLHPFRMGKNPYRKRRQMTEDEKATAATSLARAREARRAKEPPSRAEAL